MVECEHGAVGAADVAVCPPCQATHGTVPLSSGPEFGRAFPAAYPGHCGGCDFPITPGQEICWRDVDGVTDYRHAGACTEDTA